MTSRIARWIGWSIVVTYIILTAAGLILQGLSHAFYAQIEPSVLISLTSLVGVWMIIGVLIISRHPRHPVGWLLCAGFFTSAFDMLSAGILAYDTFVSSGTLPGVNLALIWLKLENLGPLGLVPLTLIVLIFPDGRFFMPGWRKLAWIAVVTLLLFLPIQALEPGPADAAFLPERINPFGVSVSLWAYLKPLLWTGFSILVLCYWAAFASLLVRLRNSRGDVRQQVKWLLFPVGLYGFASIPFFFGAVAADAALMDFALVLLQLAIAGIVIAIAFAIFKYRLYNIDTIVNRTLVYGALSVIVACVYALIVGGMAMLFQSSGNMVIALVATGLVAVLFNPLRQRLQQAVNRLLYGERDEPLSVLRRLGERLESSGTPEDTLPAIVETVTQALKLPYAEITLQHGEGFKRAAWYGRETNEMVQFSIQYQGQNIGYLNVAVRGPEESLAESDEELLRQIARQAGPVAQAVQLTRDLRQSHARLVTAREEERRRLRRDLHDGLGPVLASQGLKIAAVSHLLDSNPETARKLLDELASQNEATVAEIRRLVYALRPPELDELGLAGAVRDYAAGLASSMSDDIGFEINVQPTNGDLPELPATIEVAAYRIATEAITNVTRHAHASYCTISFKMDANGNENILLLEIADDGVGFPNNGKKGIGLNSMRERAEEVGGTIRIESTPQKGTRLVARFPLVA